MGGEAAEIVRQVLGEVQAGGGMARARHAAQPAQGDLQVFEKGARQEARPDRRPVGVVLPQLEGAQRKVVERRERCQLAQGAGIA